MIVLVIRTRKPFFRSPPGKWLFGDTLAIMAVTLVFPFTFLGAEFGFVSLPPIFLMLMGGIVLLYGIPAEFVKHLFYRNLRR